MEPKIVRIVQSTLSNFILVEYVMPVAMGLESFSSIESWSPLCEEE